MTAAQDAAVLYFALHGTDASLTCSHLNDEVDGEPLGSNRCGGTLAGICHDDGAPLCAAHVVSEGGRLLDEDVLAELWIVKRTLAGLSVNSRGRYYPPQSNLEAFAMKVAGIDVTDNSRVVEARIRGYAR